jgi:hypothetical protein
MWSTVLNGMNHDRDEFAAGVGRMRAGTGR